MVRPVPAPTVVPGTAAMPATLRGGVVAIGNFDGVHLGHRAVLDTALAQARRRGVPAVALTFEPHPRTFFRPAEPIFRLTPAPMKRRLLGLLGFDAVVEQPFDAAFAACSAHDFVERKLVGDLGAAGLVAGYDFHFGHDREGTPDFLHHQAAQQGVGVELVTALRDPGGGIVSSSRIRALLGEGDIGGASALLGYRHLVEAEVTHGRQLGRTLGFPTANMALPPQYGLREGIHAVRLRRADGSLHDGVASFGRRPTVEDDGARLLETFVFDFSGDLYGETCTVSFFAFLRGEEKFDGLDALTAQMHRDAAAARAVLASAGPLGPVDQALSFR